MAAVDAPPGLAVGAPARGSVSAIGSELGELDESVIGSIFIVRTGCCGVALLGHSVSSGSLAYG